MITILDIAREEAIALTDDSVAVHLQDVSKDKVLEHFTRRRFLHLYRRYMMNTVGRRISNRECEIAFTLAQEEQPGDGK